MTRLRPPPHCALCKKPIEFARQRIYRIHRLPNGWWVAIDGLPVHRSCA